MADVEFEVKLARTGRLVPVHQEESVLDALAKAGIDVPTSCQQGVCGTCETRVLEGECDHWDMYLTPEEQEANDRFMPCVSRAKTPLLVIDL